MLKRVSFSAAIVALMWALAPSAEAVPIVGGMSISGSLVPVIGSTGVETPTLATATGLDFTLSGHVPSPGIDGSFFVNSTTGDFNGLIGSTGSISDFTFAGPGSTDFPTVPPTLMAFQTGISGFSFDLSSITNVLQSSNILTLEGTGLFHLSGFDDTFGTFVFSANQFADTFSFSASEGTIPEPGSMILLGTGLIGLAGAARRRWLATA